MALQCEQILVDCERERTDALSASFSMEKMKLQRQVTELTEKISVLTAEKHSEATGEVTTMTASETNVNETSEAVRSEAIESSPTEHTTSTSVPGTVEDEAGTEFSTMSQDTVSAILVSTMEKLFKAQTEAIAAQMPVTATQHLPPLKSFTGDDLQEEEKTFDRWLELFEERAKLAGWGPARHLHQLKLLLEKTALKAYHTFVPADHDDYDRAVEALRKRFKLVDIEELRGHEFHHKMQGKETIEELGMELQMLGRKAFPSSHGKEFDRLLSYSRKMATEVGCSED